jgi:hypothetical protein
MVLGSGIRDPGSGKTYSGSRIQGSKSNQSRIPDPDPQHCLIFRKMGEFLLFAWRLRVVHDRSSFKQPVLVPTRKEIHLLLVESLFMEGAQ